MREFVSEGNTVYKVDERDTLSVGDLEADYWAYLSEEDSTQAVNYFKTRRKEGGFKSEDELRDFFDSLKRKRYKKTGGRFVYFVLIEDKKGKYYYSSQIKTRKSKESSKPAEETEESLEQKAEDDGAVSYDDLGINPDDSLPKPSSGHRAGGKK